VAEMFELRRESQDFSKHHAICLRALRRGANRRPRRRNRHLADAFDKIDRVQNTTEMQLNAKPLVEKGIEIKRKIVELEKFIAS
jgi:hypothetical protein